MLLAGDIAGLETLVRLYQTRALRTAYNITGSIQIAEDVVADSSLTVYERIHSYDLGRPFAPWFYRIVVNRALKTVSRTRYSVSPEPGVELNEGPRDPSVEPDSVVLQREEQAAVFQALDSLPPKQRAVIVLPYYLDFDEQSIAQIVGVPRGTVKWRLHAARARLKGSLDRASMAPSSRPKGELL